MNAEILCVGTELLLGDIVNTNASYLAKELALLGVGCYYQTVVGDNPERLEQSISLALSRADMVIMTGGLGPTYDDLTKETVAKYFGRKMQLHEPSLEYIRSFFKRIGREMTSNNEKQAYMPEGAIVFENDRGTAPGLALENSESKTAILMPGPPREMTAMFEQKVLPYLKAKSNKTFRSHSIHLFGIGESTVEEILRDKIKDMQNPTVAPYAKEGEVLLRVTASAESDEAADRIMKPVIDDICGIFGERVYGVDVGTLQNALVQSLSENGKTIAVAESCTGGLISSRITDIAGSSKVFGYGCTTYANSAKTELLSVAPEILENHGAVSRETAMAMARGVRELSGADIGIATTGVAGPDGGTSEKPVGLVWVGVSTAAGDEAHELHLSRGYGGDRAIIRNSAASYALFLALRESLRGLS